MSRFFDLVQSTLDDFLEKADLKNFDHDHEEENERA